METLYDLKYFVRGETFSASSFNNKDRLVKINLNFIISIDELETFRLPFSGQAKEAYSVVTMSNNDRYVIRAEEYVKLTNHLNNGKDTKTS